MHQAIYYLFIILFAFPAIAEIRICTQNLGNFGDHEVVIKRTNKSKKELLKQKAALTKSFYQAKCDLIATQEVISSTPEDAIKVLESLASELSKLTHKKYLVVSGQSNDPFSKQGYILRQDLFRLEYAESYSDYLLKPLTRWEKNRYFSRGPLRIDLREIKTGQKLTLINFHFKSKAAFHSFDSTKFQFEYDRLQMAQGLHDIANNIQKELPENLMFLLGDRNSTYESASARTLAGEIDLSHFKQQICQLSKDLTADCNTKLPTKPKYISLLEQAGKTLYPNEKIIKNFTRIDEILIAKKSLETLQKNNYKISAKMLARDLIASDHSLFYITIKKSN